MEVWLVVGLKITLTIYDFPGYKFPYYGLIKNFGSYLLIEDVSVFLIKLHFQGIYLLFKNKI